MTGAGRRPAALLIVFGGLPGTGKTTLARTLRHYPARHLDNTPSR